MTAQSINRSWSWLLALGILFIILGGIGLSMVVGLTILSMVFFGILLITGGACQLIDAFKDRHWKGTLWHTFIGMLYIAGGALVIYDPLLASAVITAMLAGVLIVMGLTRIVMAFSMRQTSAWGWVFLAGLLALVLGIMILTHWPVSGLWIIGLFLAIEIMVTGWTYVFLAFALRSGK